MTRRDDKRRAPAALRADDPHVSVREAEPIEALPAPAAGEEAQPPATIRPEGALTTGIKWGGILLSALAGLVSLAAGLWLADFVGSLVARNDWLGWLTLGLLTIAVFAAAMIVLAELWALLRLRRLGLLRHAAESAVNHGDKGQAERVARGLMGLYSSRPELSWGRARFAEHEGDIMDARELLVLAERELVGPLDEQARAIVAASARRVSVLTAVSPSSIVDMAFVTVQNLRMLRRIAAAYGARPGTLGLLRLARMVVAHIVLTGGIAIGDDLLQQMIGHGLTAKLSARLGEGVFNGALTTRIGLAAIDISRPLPFIETRRPRFRDLVARALK